MRKCLRTTICIAVLGLLLSIPPSVFVDTAMAANPKTKILIAGGRVGGSFYIFSQALGSFINKNSTWLEADVAASPGLTANFQLVRDNPQNYMAVGNFGSFLQFRKKGPISDKAGMYMNARFISNATSQTVLWVTFNKNIRSSKDFIGKKVNTHRHGAAIADDMAAVLKGWGIFDQIKITRTAWGEGVSLLMDGMVDVIGLPVDHVYPYKFEKSASIAKLESKGPVYYAGMEDPKLLRDLREKMHATVPVKVPAKAMDAKTQPNELWAFGDPVFFFADESMNPDIVYEVTRIICESAGKWGSWHPQGAHMTMDFIPATPFSDKNLVHPAAMKYYKEHGIEVVDIADRLQ